MSFKDIYEIENLFYETSEIATVFQASVSRSKLDLNNSDGKILRLALKAVEKHLKKKHYEILKEVMEPFKDSDCRYDHHGYCQEHFLHQNPCPYGRAKKLLDG